MTVPAQVPAGSADDPEQSAVLQTFPLAQQWQTLDPFLFCVHHLDAYPKANEFMGPDAALHARDIGMDFSGTDGWNMYHGSVVPGFPQHPHRGFETVTLVRRGLVDHSDSLGAAARFGGGDVQWLTAGAGVVHSEMFPLLDRNEPNPLELFQIWLNLPAANKMSDPYFTMLWAEDIPTVEVGTDTAVTVVAGALDGRRPPEPPPDSWASQPDSDLAIWVISMGANGEWTLPAAGDDTVRVLYLFEGAGMAVDATPVVPRTGAVLRSDTEVTLRCLDGGAGARSGTEALLLQGRPIGDPVAQYGPFVMNDKAGIQQAFEDYRRTGFGGWPWPTDDPVHGAERGRFARHVDGRVEEPTG